METLEAIRTRRSIRKFMDRPVPDGVIQRVLEAGIRAPSGGNRQPWRFVVVTDREKIRQFDPYAHQPWVEDAGQVIVACADPHDTWERYDENDPCFLMDTCAAIQNMLLAIHDLGLGAVWVLTFSKRKVRELLGLPLHWQIVSIVPFGYYDTEDEAEFRGEKLSNRPPTSRRPLSEVAFRDSINNPIAP